MANNATASSKDMKNKIDSLAKVIYGKLDTLNINITEYVDGEVFSLENEIDGIQTTVNENSSKLATHSTNISNINSMMNQLVSWAKTINAKNDSLAKEIDKVKAKHKADSTEADTKYRELVEKMNNLSEDKLSALISQKITEALSGINTTVTGLSTKVGTLETSVASLDDAINNNTNGLATKVGTLETSVGSLDDAINNNTTGLTTKVGVLDNAINNTTDGLATKVGVLETSVGTLNSAVNDATNGLSPRVEALETSVGTLNTAVNDATTGLSPRVEALENKVQDLDSRVETLEH